MRELTVNAFVTLDGVMQAPGGPEEDPTGGFAHGGWSVNYWDDSMGKVMAEFFPAPSAGRQVSGDDLVCRAHSSS